MGRDALVVGVDTYQHIPHLKTPGNDAEAIAQRLEKDGEFRVWRLPEVVIDGKPTVGQRTAVSLAELKQALVKLFKPNSDQYADTALLYFSGHGLRETLGIAEGYLATSDVNPQQDFWGLSLRWLRRLLAESPVRQQIIWLDCCHSGELLSFGEADPGDRALARDRSFIAASRAYEPAYEETTGNHSVLTQALLDGLEPTRLRDRWVTNLSLTDFINETLKTEIQTPVCNNAGEPINLTRAWQQAAAAAPETAKTDNAICPYKGLSYFDNNNEDYRYFYGRQSLTDELLDAVRQSNFVAIAGASGSGKSSVLRAGLLHQLRVGRRIFGSDQWEVRLMVPGETPCQNLAAAFIDENLSRVERAEQQGKAEALINEGAAGLRRLVQTAESPRVLLVIDQFEEVFTLCQDVAERERFLATVLGALNTTANQLGVILAMRADFVGRCFEQTYSGLAEQVQNHLVAVKPMGREELRDAIVKPAEQVGLTLEPELVTTLLNDVEKAPGSLPLLQYTLTELWQQRQDDTLRLTPYAQLGGVTGTLKQRADKVYQQLTPAQQRTAKHIFLSLTHLGEGAEDTRRRIKKRSLITTQHSEALVNDVVKHLADANLIITNSLVHDIGSDSNGHIAVIDLTHEALIHHWSLLRKWIDEARRILIYKRHLEVTANIWLRRGKLKQLLLEEKEVLLLEKIYKTYYEWFSINHTTELFLKESIEAIFKNHRKDRYLKLGIFITSLIGGFISLLNPSFLSLSDLSLRTLFFELRGPVAPPEDIVILAIDNSLNYQNLFQESENPDFNVINQWPYRREAYAIAIERLIHSGAKSVALDIVLRSPSTYGPEDDKTLVEVLNRMGDQVVLATSISRKENSYRAVLPISSFLETPIQLGSIGFDVEEDGRIHRNGSTFILSIQNLANFNEEGQSKTISEINSFSLATLKAAQISDYEEYQRNIFFYGPGETFEHVPFWKIFDSYSWENELQSGDYFRDKIVLIGSTADLHGDFHPTPFSGMHGVEVLANDISSILYGTSLNPVFQNSYLEGAFIIIIVFSFGYVEYVIARKSRLKGVIIGVSSSLLFVGFSFLLFAWYGLLLPVTVPLSSIIIISFLITFLGTVPNIEE